MVRRVEGLAVCYVYEHWRADKGVCFYVGKGSRGRSTEMNHGRNRHHQAIQAKLRRLGLCVDVRVIARGLTNDEALAFEIERIAFWRSCSTSLTNRTNGGEGAWGMVMSKASIEKMAAKKRGVKRGPQSAEHRRKIGEAQKGKILSESHRAKLRKAWKARRKTPVTEATKAKRAATFAAMSPEEIQLRRQRISQAGMGRTRSAEVRAKISKSSKGKIIPPEQRAKIAATLRARGKGAAQENGLI